MEGLILAEARRLLAERRSARIRGLVMLVAYAVAISASVLAPGPSLARLVATVLALVAVLVAIRELRAAREASARLHRIALVLAATRTRGSA